MGLQLSNKFDQTATEEVAVDLHIDFVRPEDCATLQQFLRRFSGQLFQSAQPYRYGRINSEEGPARGLLAIADPAPNSTPYLHLSQQLLEGRDLTTLGELKFVGERMQVVSNDIASAKAFLPVQHIPLVRSQITAACLHFMRQENSAYDFSAFANKNEEDLAFAAMSAFSKTDFTDLSMLVHYLGMRGFLDKETAQQEVASAYEALMRFSKSNDLGTHFNLKNDNERYENNDIAINVWNTSVSSLGRLLESANIRVGLEEEANELQLTVLSFIDNAEDLRTASQRIWLENMIVVLDQASKGNIDDKGLKALRKIQAVVAHANNPEIQTDFLSYLCSLNRFYSAGTLESDVMMQPDTAISTLVGRQVSMQREPALLT